MHGYTRMGNYKGDPFIVGNYWPQENAETEIMNHETGLEVQILVTHIIWAV